MTADVKRSARSMHLRCLRRRFIPLVWLVGAGACSGTVEAPTQLKLEALTTGEPGATETEGTAGNAIAFDLGDVRATREYFFTLRNTSDAPITDIKLTTRDAAYIVEPAHIASLAPDAGELATTVRLTVLHGRAASGIGQAPILPMGENTAALSIEAEQNGAPVTFAAELKLVAKVAALALTDAEGNPVEARYGTLVMVAPHYSGRYQSYCINDELFVTNTGNVALNVRQDFSPPLFTLAPGEKQTVSAPWRTSTTLWVYSTDAVGDPVAFPSDNSGSTALHFTTLPTDCVFDDSSEGAGGAGGTDESAGGEGGSAE